MSDEQKPTDEQVPAQRLEAPELVLQLTFHAPDGTPILSVGCPAEAIDATGVHLPALVLLQALYTNYTAWQQAQPKPKPSGILVPPRHSRLSVAQENAEKLQSALEQIRPRPGKRHD